MSELPDDETIRVRRSWPGDPPAATADDFLLDEVTEVSRRRGAASVPPPRDAVPPVVRRSTYIDSDDTADDVDEATDGSTIVAHRESRRRASGRDVPPASAVQTPAASNAARMAHAPDPAAGDRYGVRDAAPVIASRTAVPHTSPQQPIDGDAQARRRRDGRRTILIVAGATSAVVVTAAVTLMAIIFSL